MRRPRPRSTSRHKLRHTGDLFAELYTLNLPANAPPNLTYYAGLYNWQDRHTHLHVNGGLDDKLVLYGS